MRKRRLSTNPICIGACVLSTKRTKTVSTALVYGTVKHDEGDNRWQVQWQNGSLDVRLGEFLKVVNHVDEIVEVASPLVIEKADNGVVASVNPNSIVELEYL